MSDARNENSTKPTRPFESYRIKEAAGQSEAAFVKMEMEVAGLPEDPAATDVVNMDFVAYAKACGLAEPDLLLRMLGVRGSSPRISTIEIARFLRDFGVFVFDQPAKESRQLQSV